MLKAIGKERRLAYYLEYYWYIIWKKNGKMMHRKPHKRNEYTL